jgi:ABC-type glutathione transport system ATPase component
VIVAEHLEKVFHTLHRRPGFVGGLASLLAPQRVATKAVNGVSLTVRRGELLALLGPNGASCGRRLGVSGARALTRIAARAIGTRSMARSLDTTRVPLQASVQ